MKFLFWTKLKKLKLWLKKKHDDQTNIQQVCFIYPMIPHAPAKHLALAVNNTWWLLFPNKCIVWVYTVAAPLPIFLQQLDHPFLYHTTTIWTTICRDRWATVTDILSLCCNDIVSPINTYPFSSSACVIHCCVRPCPCRLTETLIIIFLNVVS